MGLLLEHTDLKGFVKVYPKKAKFKLEAYPIWTLVKTTGTKNNFTKADLKRGLPNQERDLIVDKLEDAESDIDYAEILLSDGYGIQLFYKKGLYSSIDYVDANVNGGYYTSPLHVAKSWVKDIQIQLRAISDVTYTDTRSPIFDSGQYVGIVVNYNPDTQILSFVNKIPNCTASLVRYQTSEELHRVLGMHHVTEPVAKKN